MKPFGIFRFPDSASGAAEAEVDAKSAEEDFFKRPPDKRPNFVKLGISSPFGPNWKRLLNFKDDDDKTFFVIRDLNDDIRKSEFDEKTLATALVQVRVISTGKGTCATNSVICQPNQQDLKTTDDENQDPVESPLEDFQQVKVRGLICTLV